MPQDTPAGKALPIEREYPPDLPTLFANDVVVQHVPDYFIISFFDIFVPLILGTTDVEKLAQLDRLSSVKAKCIARLALTPRQIKSLVEALTENYEQWQKSATSQAQEHEANT